MITTIYKYSPEIVQNWILTLKSSHTFYLKFGAIPFFRPLHKIVSQIKQDLIVFNDAGVMDRAKTLIKSAINDTVYYSNKKNIYSAYTEGKKDFQSLPILEKQTLKMNGGDFVSKLCKSGNSYRYKTSGTTGAPLTGYISKTALRERFNMVLQSMAYCGIDYSRKVARFSGSEIVENGNVYRKDYFSGHLYFSIYHISERTIKAYHNAINNNKVEILEGYPSTIYSLAVLFKRNGLNLPKVKHVITTAEKLLSHQRELIETVFKTTVFDYYGSSEGSSYIFNCKYGKYHNVNKLSLLEVVDENNREVSFGAEGKMLVTSFSTDFTPLVRYDIGDRCKLSANQVCACGIGGLVIDEIIGRSDDEYTSPDGKVFSRFSLCLKFLPQDVVRSKLLLKNYSYDVKVLVELPSSKDKETLDFKPFEEKFASMLGEGYLFVYEFVDKIELGNNGKFKVVTIEKD